MPISSFDGRRRVVIEGVSPAVDGGRFPAKRVAGDVVSIEADVFADGHDLLSAVVMHRHQRESKPRETRMTAIVNDRWRAEIQVEELGFYFFTIEAWVDHFLTWHRDLQKRDKADLPVQLQIGLGMIRAASSRAKGRDKKRLAHFVEVLEGDDEIEDKMHDVKSDELLDLMWRNSDRPHAARLECEYPIEVDRPKAAFSTWYELFPRSVGTFRDMEAQLPGIAKMGFDVLYLPPIHPIGKTFRKGRNNVVNAGPNDVGSPWAIGGGEGGHTAIHPQLGNVEDFRRLVTSAKEKDRKSVV